MKTRKAGGMVAFIVAPLAITAMVRGDETDTTWVEANPNVIHTDPTKTCKANGSPCHGDYNCTKVNPTSQPFPGRMGTYYFEAVELAAGTQPSWGNCVDLPPGSDGERLWYDTTPCAILNCFSTYSSSRCKGPLGPNTLYKKNACGK